MTIRADDITVCIPAAGRVPDGTIALANVTCPAMIPVGGRPVIHWTLRYLSGLGITKYRVAVASRGLLVEDFVDCAYRPRCDVDFIVPSKQAGVGRTVLDLLEGVTTRAALVVLGDTHFELADPTALEQDAPFVVTHEVDESYRWCTVNVAGDVVTALHDKVPGLPTPAEALVGVYFFPDVAVAREAARAAVAERESVGRSTELAAILERIRAVTPLKATRAKLWSDVGNPDMLSAAHRTLLASRAFNEVSVDPIFGTLTKRSRHKSKLVDEILYLRSLPSDVAILFPRVLESSVAPDSPFVTMEYYGYPTLADVFLFEAVDVGIWQRVFEHLDEVVERGFLRHPVALPPGAVRQMYVEKTRARLADVATNTSAAGGELARLISASELVVNGKRLRGMTRLWSAIEERVAKLEASAVGTIIHGDLCFSNILYDLRSRVVKLVDPRGSFGAPGAFGDMRYDVAKLYHSVAGHYDFIVNDLFRVHVADNDVKLDIRTRPQHDEIEKRFERVFFRRFDRKEITLITGLLFASMVPLHADAPQRQVAMYARALQILDEALA